MKSFKLFLTSLLLCNTAYPVIENITQAKDPQGEKTFVFLHDAHFGELVEPVNHFLGAQGSEKLNAVVQEQNKIFQDKLLDALSGKNQSHKKTILITETNNELLSESVHAILNSEEQPVPEEIKNEILKFVPYLFFMDATKSESEPRKKSLLLQDYIIDNVDIPVSFTRPSHSMSWIIGDRLRSTADMYIGRLIPRDWQLMKPYVEQGKKNELGLKAINIRYVKNHITNLQIFLNQKNIPDTCCQKALNIINELLAEEKIAESDHLVHVQEYLVQKNQQSVQQALNLNMLKATSKRFDAELLNYIERLNEIDKEATLIVLLIGNTHAQNVLDILWERGYQVGEPLTTDNGHFMEEGLTNVIANAAIVNNALQSSSWFNEL